MYNKRILLIALCAIAALISCNKVSKPELTVEDFKQEERLSVIAEKINLFTTISCTDTGRVMEEYNIMQENIDYLVKKYGKQNAKAFARELLQRSRTPSASSRTAMAAGCCKLNANGTTDQSCCNFWESIVVAFETLDCSRPYPGAPKSDVRDFYECIQAEVCENC